VSSEEIEKKAEPAAALLPKPAPRTPPVDAAVSQETGEEDGTEDEDEESETTSEESSSEEDESTAFVEYDAEPVSKARSSQSRSESRSAPESSAAKSLQPAVSERQATAEKVAQSSRLTNAESAVSGANLRASHGRGDQPEKSKSPVSKPSRVLEVGRVSQPSSRVVSDVGKSQKSPTVSSSVVPDYTGQLQRLSSVHSPLAGAEVGHTLKFERSPSPVANEEPGFPRKSRRSGNDGGAQSPQLEYAQLESEPMARNRNNIPFVDDDELPPVPGLPGRGKSALPLVENSRPAAPTSPLVSQPSFLQSFEAPTQMVTRAAAGPVMMAPQSTARIESSPVLRVNPESARSESRPTSTGSVSRTSPYPPTVPDSDAVSQLFTKLETGYTNPPGSRMSGGGHEPSYGPGYKPPAHGALVR